jgi:GT2 family glycosyltransferase
MADLTIIVIARDVRDEALACLASLEHAGDVTVQSILVDNGSADGTVEAVGRRFPQTELVCLSANEGGSARNHGLRRATGRHRMFLDSDALLTPGALRELVDFLDARPDVGLIGPRLEYPDGRFQPSARRLPPRRLPALRRPPLDHFFENRRTVRRHLMHGVARDTVREAEYVIGAAMMFSAHAQHAAGELDPRIPFAPEDIDWCVSIREAGYRIAYVPGARVVHDYRRTTAAKPWSSASLQHLYGFAYFYAKRRRIRRKLIAEGAAMAARGWQLPPRAPAPHEPLI